MNDTTSGVVRSYMYHEFEENTDLYYFQLRQSSLAGRERLLEVRRLHVLPVPLVLLQRVLERANTQAKDNQKSSETVESDRLAA